MVHTFHGEPCPYQGAGEGGSLSDVIVIMRIMCVLMVKSLCQVVMGQVPVLECMLSGVHGRPRLCLVTPCV
jgi:hypothetical protein